MSDVVQEDRERSKQFMLRTMKALNETAVMQMVSLGNRTGLFDAMAGMDPSSATARPLGDGGEEKARETFSIAGFNSIEVQKVVGDTMNDYYVCTK